MSIKNLELQYDLAMQSVVKLNAVTHQYLSKAMSVSKQITERFLSQKDKVKSSREINFDDINTNLTPYQISLIKQLTSSYSLTHEFLKSYLKEAFNIKADSSTTVFHNCLKNDLITSTEFNELSKLSINFDAIVNSASHPEISQEIIQYCLMMYSVVERFKKN